MFDGVFQKLGRDTHVTIGDVRGTITEIRPTGREEVGHKTIIPEAVSVDECEGRIRGIAHRGNARPMKAASLNTISCSTNKCKTHPII